MKNLILSAIFAVVAFSSNAQVVTIKVYQQQELTSLDSTSTIQEVLKNPDFVSDTNLVFNDLTYTINFDTKRCTVSANGFESESCDIRIINKKSSNTFTIQFVIPNNPASYGIDVTSNTAVLFEKYRTINVTNFTAFFIN
jgi:hypothetical protein